MMLACGHGVLFCLLHSFLIKEEGGEYFRENISDKEIIEEEDEIKDGGLCDIKEEDNEGEDEEMI